MFIYVYVYMCICLYVYMCICVYVYMHGTNTLYLLTLSILYPYRACTPIAVCLIDYLFMDRDPPSPRSALSLLIVALGAVLYCTADSQLTLHGIRSYSWVIIYFFLITYAKPTQNPRKTPIKPSKHVPNIVFLIYLYTIYLSFIPHMT
jgi:drug/metabolite transporter (DMT)-like permease